MNEKLSQIVNSKKAKLAAAMVLVYAVLLYYPTAISLFIDKIEFVHVELNEWRADVSSLPPGKYSSFHRFITFLVGFIKLELGKQRSVEGTDQIHSKLNKLVASRINQ